MFVKPELNRDERTNIGLVVNNGNWFHVFKTENKQKKICEETGCASVHVCVWWISVNAAQMKKTGQIVASVNRKFTHQKHLLKVEFQKKKQKKIWAHRYSARASLWWPLWPHERANKYLAASWMGSLQGSVWLGPFKACVSFSIQKWKGVWASVKLAA